MSRIGRDIAWLLSSMPEVRVGYLARGGVGRAEFPWVSYSYPASMQWGEDYIQGVWEDFARDEKGIIFTIWDASRLLWFTHFEGLPPRLANFLTSGKFKRWGYFMQDAEGVAPGILPLGAANVMSAYDRILLASKWAFNLTTRTIQGHPDIDWIPHGLVLDNFKRTDRLWARSGWALNETARVAGCVMANQERKQWPVVLEAIARTPDTWLWMHPDREIGYWNLPALVHEYGLDQRVRWDQRHLTDKELAMRYSACDALLLASGGEGFAYPVAEAQACGCPVIAGEYGAHRELMGNGCVPVPPRAFQVRTQHAVRMAVYSGEDFAAAIQAALQTVVPVDGVEFLDWSKIGRVWKKWVRNGLY